MVRELPPEKDHGPHTLRVWEGTVVGLSGDDVFVELGPRMQGVISVRKFDEAPAAGDCFEFTLRGREEDLWVLALADSRPLASWEDMEPGSLVSARVTRAVPGGLQLKIGPLHAFMPRSQTGLARGKSPAELVGRTITCEVIEVDAERQRVVLSRKKVLERERDSRLHREIGSIKPGDVVHGRVTRVEDYGAFVSFGQGLQGMIHVSNLTHERVQHANEILKKGDSVSAKVLSIRRAGRRIGLGLKQMKESPWKALERTAHEGQIVEGVVTKLAEFGAFVALQPGVEGLLHDSESGHERRVREILRAGQRISVRILALDAEAERLSLSMVHKNGSPLVEGEAEGARSFDAWRKEGVDAPLGTQLGPLLRRAFPAGEGEPG